MAARAKQQTTTPVGPVFQPEALERLLPHCDNDPHKVADRLDTQHRGNKIQLLGGGIVMSPGSNPKMLGIKAHIPPDGRAVLYVQIREDLGDVPGWGPGETVERLERHHQFWAYERTTFDEKNSPDALISEQQDHSSPPLLDLDKRDYAPIADAPIPDKPKNRGGHPDEYDRMELVEEAFVYVAAKGLPKTATGQGGLHEQLKLRLGSRCPDSPSHFSKLLGTLFKRAKDEQSRNMKPVAKSSPRLPSKIS